MCLGKQLEMMTLDTWTARALPIALLATGGDQGQRRPQRNLPTPVSRGSRAVGGLESEVDESVSR